MSPEMRAMLKEQDWYNQQINGMLDVLTVFVTKDTPTGVGTANQRPIFKEEECNR